jgi:hypothetical protein
MFLIPRRDSMFSRRKLLNSVVLIAVALTISVTPAFATWTITTPANNDSFSKTLDVACSGGSTGPGMAFAVQCKDKDGVVRSNFSGSSGSMNATWFGNLVKPSPSWDNTLNNYQVILTPGNGETGVTHTISFSPN